ncbi:MAG: J domain-containing protein [Desulfamplus sp.]|nr:J domain-containing protein [Desulfamplus sp.]
MEKQDYYKILGIDKNVTSSDIKKAYKNFAIKYHPDRNPDDPHASEKMAALNEAYAVLSNPEKKREYDILKDRFGDDAAGRFRQSNNYDDILKNSDLEKIFQEIADSFGIRGLHDIFNININTHTGNFSSSNFGNQGVHGGGFFFFGTFGQQPQSGYSSYSKDELAKLKPHQRIMREVGGKIFKKVVDKFVNEGLKKLNISQSDMLDGLSASTKMDIYDTITLSSAHAQNGGPYAYYHKQNDKKLIVKIPPNIQNGHKIRLKGAGMENSKTKERGDLFLVINVKDNMLSKIKRALQPFS